MKTRVQYLQKDTETESIPARVEVVAAVFFAKGLIGGRVLPVLVLLQVYHCCSTVHSTAKSPSAPPSIFLFCVLPQIEQKEVLETPGLRTEIASKADRLAGTFGRCLKALSGSVPEQV